MPNREGSIPGIDFDEQLTISLLDKHNKKISRADEQKIMVSGPGPLPIFQTCNSSQDQNPVNEREAMPQQLNTTVIALVFFKDHYHTIFSYRLRTIGHGV